MQRAALVLDASETSQRFLRLQVKVAQRLCRRIYGNTALELVVLTRSPITVELQNLCLPNARLLRVLPGYLLPPSLVRRYELLILIEAHTLPVTTDIIYLLNTEQAVQILEARPANAWHWVFQAYSAIGNGLVAIHTRKLLKPLRGRPAKQRSDQKPQHYKKYSTAERACLTAWVRGVEFHTRSGVSRRYTPAAIWQSWHELFRLGQNLYHKRPLPGLTIRPRHFRLIATHLAILLSLLFAGQGWMYLYQAAAFAFSYDYFFPAERPWSENLKFLPVRLLYLPFA